MPFVESNRITAISLEASQAKKLATIGVLGWSLSKLRSHNIINLVDSGELLEIERVKKYFEDLSPDQKIDISEEVFIWGDY